MQDRKNLAVRGMNVALILSVLVLQLLIAERNRASVQGAGYTDRVPEIIFAR